MVIRGMVYYCNTNIKCVVLNPIEIPKVTFEMDGKRPQSGDFWKGFQIIHTLNPTTKWFKEGTTNLQI